MSLSQEPDAHGNHKPGDRRERGSRNCRQFGKGKPEDHSKTSQTDAAERSSGGIHSRHRTATVRAVETRTSLVFLLVCFYERCSGGENRGERQEKAANTRTEPFRDQSCHDANRAAEKKAHDIFMRLDSFDGGEFCVNHHLSYRNRKNHNATEVRN